MAGHAGASPILNGGFESGLTGWNAIGLVSAVGDQSGYTPAEGARQGWLSNAFDDNNYVSIDDLEGFLGVAMGTLTGDATEGSAVYQDLVVQAGDVLKFTWGFTTADGDQADYAFLLVGSQLGILGTAPTSTGYAPSSYTFGQSGNVRVAFGLVDALDVVGDSELFLDGVELQPVPEPATMALLGTGLVGMLRAARRRRA